MERNTLEAEKICTENIDHLYRPLNNTVGALNNLPVVYKACSTYTRVTKCDKLKRLINYCSTDGKVRQKITWFMHLNLQLIWSLSTRSN